MTVAQIANTSSAQFVPTSSFSSAWVAEGHGGWADTKQRVEELMGKGFAGTVFLTPDDVDASFEELKGRGVEFVDEPHEQPHGIDSSFRDPSGNNVRLTQLSSDF